MRTMCKRMGWFLALAVAISVAGTGSGQIGPGGQPANTISIVGDNSTAGQVTFNAQFSGFAYGCIQDCNVQIYKVTVQANGTRVSQKFGNVTTRTYNPVAASGGQNPGPFAAGNKGDTFQAYYYLTAGNPAPPVNAVLGAWSLDSVVK